MKKVAGLDVTRLGVTLALLCGGGVATAQTDLIENSPWKMAGYNYERTACRDYATVLPLPPPGQPPPQILPGSPVWTYTTPSPQPINTGVVFGPVANPGAGGSPVTRVYFGCDDGYLYALDIDRDNPDFGQRATLAWRYWVGYPVRSTPCLVQFGTGGYGLAFGADNGTVYCLRSNGTLQWSTSIGAVVRGSPFFRPGLGMAPGGEAEAVPSAVIVGSVTSQGQGRLVALKVNPPNAGSILYEKVPYLPVGNGLVGSPSYYPIWEQVGEDRIIVGGYVFVTDLAGNLRRFYENRVEFVAALERTFTWPGPPPRPPCMGWPTLGPGETIRDTVAYFASGPNDQGGGYIYAVKHDYNTDQLLSKWTQFGQPYRIADAWWTPMDPNEPTSDVRIGHIYADPCKDIGGQLYFGTWIAGTQDGWGMFLKVNDLGSFGTATVLHDFWEQPREVRATPCVGVNGVNMWIAFADSAGYLHVRGPAGPAVPPFPVSIGAAAGLQGEQYGARPHVVLDNQGILYIGNNAGQMRAIWAPFSR